MAKSARFIANNVKCSGRRNTRQLQTIPTSSKKLPTQVRALATRSSSFTAKTQRVAVFSAGKLGGRMIDDAGGKGAATGGLSPGEEPPGAACGSSSAGKSSSIDISSASGATGVVSRRPCSQSTNIRKCSLRIMSHRGCSRSHVAFTTASDAGITATHSAAPKGQSPARE